MNLSVKDPNDLSKEPYRTLDNPYINPNLIRSKEFIENSMMLGYLMILTFVFVLTGFIYSTTHPQYIQDSTSKISVSTDNKASDVITIAKRDSGITNTDFKNDGWLVLTTSDTVTNAQKKAQRYASMAKILKASDIIGVKIIDTNNRTLGIAF